MQTYNVKLQSEVANSYRVQRAANSVDLDVSKKLCHEFSIRADLSEYSVGLVVGASGSGKTTLAKHIWGEDCFKTELDLSKPVIDQFPEQYSYDDCVKRLNGIGLTSVPCWIRPAHTLSNGQRMRAECALQMSKSAEGEQIVIDEWTSVVDRTIGKIMSHCISKYARKMKKQVVLCSCHYDVIEWLDPDWIIDCNTQEFIDRRSLRPEERRRKERLNFTVRQVGKETWPYFSKYHYLSSELARGKQFFYGLFDGEKQIGFNAFSNYVPMRGGKAPLMHGNRMVIHPDYVGLGLAIEFVNLAARHMLSVYRCRVRASFSGLPMYYHLKRDPNWKCIEIKKRVSKKETQFMKNNRSMGRTFVRTHVTMFTFEFIQ